MAIKVRITIGDTEPQVIEVEAGGSITVTPGDVIELIGVDRADLEFELVDDDLLITFPNGDTITFVGLALALEDDNPATLAFGELSAGDIIASIDDLIETVAPAAGPGAVGISTGGTFRAGGDIDVDDLGGARVGANGPGQGIDPTPINPFGLEPSFGVPEEGAGANDVPSILDPENAVVDEDDLELSEGSSFEGTDETDPVTFTRSLGIDFGDDGPGSVSLAGNVAPLGLTSHGEAVSYTVSGDGTVLTAATADGRVIFTISVDAGTGTYTITLHDQLDHPPGDGENIGTLSFGFTATDGPSEAAPDGDSVTGFFSIDFVDDVPLWNPVVTEKSALVAGDGAGLFYAATGQGEASQLYLIDGETGAIVEVIGPIGFAVTGLAIDPTSGLLYGTTSNNSPEDPKSLILIDPTTGAGTLIGGLDVSKTMAGITFDADGTLFGWGEGQDDLFTIDLATGEATRVGESGLDTFGSGLALDPTSGTFYLFANTGDLHVIDPDTGAVLDTIALSDSSLSPGGALAFSGEPGELLAVARDGGGRQLVSIDVTTGEVTVVGDLIEPEGGEGGLKFDALEIVSPPVEVTATGIFLTVDEDDLPGGTDGSDPLVVSADLGIVFGADGPGTITLFGNVAPEDLTAHGDPVSYVISADGTMLTAVAFDGEVERDIFKITVDPSTGKATVELFDNLDHQDDLGQNVIWLPVFFTATDFDGDPVDGHFMVDIIDDVPVPDDDANMVHEQALDGAIEDFVMTFDGGEGNPSSFTEGAMTVSIVDGGDHLHLGDNDGDPSGDLFAHTTLSNPYEFALTGGGAFDLVSFEVLSISGTTTFTSSSGDTFVVTTTGSKVLPAGFDGITSVTMDTTDEIVIDDLAYSIEVFSPGTVSESDAEVTSGFLEFEIGADGPGGFTWKIPGKATDPDGVEGGEGAGDPILLTSGGAEIEYRLEDGGLVLVGSVSTGPYAGQDIFKLELTDLDTGAYAFTLLGPLDHPDSAAAVGSPGETGADDPIDLGFGYTIVDFDGDSAMGELTITVKDDGPLGAWDTNFAAEANLAGGVVEILPIMGFESGDFTGWSTLGNVSVVGDFDDGPTEGAFQALLTTGSGAVSDASLETLLGVSSGTLDGLSTGNAREGAAIKKTVTVEAGDVLTFDFNFLTDEATPQFSGFNDFAFVVITDGVGTTVLADTFSSFTSSATNFDEETGYATFTYTFTSGGTFMVGVGVVDVQDTIVDSALLVDNFLLSGDESTFVVFSPGTKPQGPHEVASGMLGYEFGADGSDGFTWKVPPVGSDLNEGGEGGTPLALTSGGDALAFRLEDGGLTLVGFVPPEGTGPYAGADILKVELTNLASGAYTFTLLGPLDHPDVDETGFDDVVEISFGYTVTDGDGDEAMGHLDIALKDDGPIADGAEGGFEFVAEANLDENDEDDPALTTGTKPQGPHNETSGFLIYEFGADGPGDFADEVFGSPFTWKTVVNAIDPDGVEGGEGAGDPISLTAGGDALSFRLENDGKTLIGFVESGSGPYAGQDIFKLELTDLESGAYTFTLLGPLDHPDSAASVGGSGETGFADLINLGFGFTITDGDGDTAMGTLTLDVKDDGPTADGAEGGFGFLAEANLPGSVVPGDEMTVAVFDNGAFVDTTNTSDAESDNVQATLAAQGHTVITFTGIDAADWTSALAGADLLLIPELENGDLAAALSQEAKDAIKAFVEGGGKLIIHSAFFGPAPEGDVDLLNAIFGFSLADVENLGGSTLGGDAVGTPFEDGPATLPGNNGTDGILTSSLPSGSLSIYTSDGATTVALIPFGDGQIVTMGWDWFNAEPVGSQDGGWLEVLDAAVRMSTVVFSPGTKPQGPHDQDSGNLIYDFGADGPGDFADAVFGSPFTWKTVVTAIDPDGVEGGEGAGDPIVLAAGGNALSFRLEDDGKTLIGFVPSGASGPYAGQDIFKLELTDLESGAYTFTLFGPLDHPDSAAEVGGSGETGFADLIKLGFGFTITDGDGDTAMGTLTLDVKDDGPLADGAEGGFGFLAEANLPGDDSFAPGFTPGTKDEGPHDQTSGNLIYEFGADGPGDFGDFVFGSPFTWKTVVTSIDPDGGEGAPCGPCAPCEPAPVPILLTSGGHELSFRLEDDGKTLIGFVPSANSGGSGPYVGQDIFKLELTDLESGAYTFTLLGPLDHPDSAAAVGGSGETGFDDLITLGFGFTITDGDGDTAMGTLTLDVKDDGPLGADDTDMVHEEALDGRIDDFVMTFEGGEGQPSSFTEGEMTVSVVDGGDHLHLNLGPNLQAHTTQSNPYEFALTGGGAFDLISFEVLFIAGTTTFTSSSGDTFVVTTTGTHVLPTGFDGITSVTMDTDDNIVIDNLAYSIQVFSPGTVSESNAEVTSDFLGYEFGADGPDDFTWKVPPSASDPEGGDPTLGPLTAGGDVLSFALSPDGDTLVGFVPTSGSGPYAGEDIFKLELTDIVTGAYTFTLLGPLDHPDVDETGLDDLIKLTFGYTITDGDGDTAMGTLALDVKDDGPLAPDSMDFVAEANLDGPDQALTTGTEPEGSGEMASGTLGYEFGADGPGDFTWKLAVVGIDPDGGEGGAGAGDPITLTAGGDVLSFRFEDDDHTLIGFVDTDGSGPYMGEDIFKLELINIDTGAWKFTLLGPLDHPDSAAEVGAPGDTGLDDLINLVVGYTITDGDGDTAMGELTIKVEDDGPVATDAEVVLPVDEDDLKIDGTSTFDGTDPIPVDPLTRTGDLGIDFGADGPGSVTLAANAGATALTSQGDEITYVVTNGGTLLTASTFWVEVGDTGVNANGVDQADFVSRDVFTVEVDAATGKYTFTLLDNLDHLPPPEGTDSEPNLALDDGTADGLDKLTFAFTATDGDGDEVESSLSVEVRDDVPLALPASSTPLSEDTETVDEVVVFKDTVASGNLGALFGADGGVVSAVTYTGDSASGEVDLVVDQDDSTETTFVLTAKAGETVIWTLEVTKASGDYKFTLLGPVDHLGGEGTVLTESFAYEVTDGDGDKSTSSLSVNIVDDVPVLGEGEGAAVNEDDLPDGSQPPTKDSLTDGGDLGIDFGADGPGAVDLSANDGLQPQDLFSDGDQIEYVVTDNDTLLTASTVWVNAGGGVNANGVTFANFVSRDVFTVEVDADTGTYTFTLIDNLDHLPDADDGPDELDLVFSFTATDGDGDETAPGSFTVTVTDDVPDAVDDVNVAEIDGDPISGNVLINDVLGADNANAEVTAISVTGGTLDDGTIVTGAFTVGVEFDVARSDNGNEVIGTMIINADGSYTFTAAPDDTTNGDTIVFQYELTDGDGDTDTATLTVTLNQDLSSILDGFIVTNTNAQAQEIRLTFTDLNNSANTFSTILILAAQGQGVEIFEDVGFVIVPTNQYLVTLHHVSGTKVIVTDITLEGVEILGQGDGNLFLAADGNLVGQNHHGLDAVIQPDQIAGDAGLISGPALSIDFGPGNDTGGTQGPVDPTAGEPVPFLYGDGGNDILTGDPGTEILDGGSGNDTLTGRGGTDVLFGEDGNDILLGKGGDDVLYGDAGDDILTGGRGEDALIGGAGNDRYVFTAADNPSDADADTVLDFTPADDVIDLSDVLGASSATNADLASLSEAISEGFVVLVDTGDDVVVKVDLDGMGNVSTPVVMVTLLNTEPLDLNDSNVTLLVV